MPEEQRKTKSLRTWSVINIGRALSFIIVLAAFPVVLSFLLVERNQDDVEGRMVDFASSLRMHVSESSLISREKLKHMESFLTPNCEIRLVSTGGVFKGKENISDFVYAIRRKAKRITILLWDRDVDKDENFAKLRCTVTLKVYFHEGRESHVGNCDMQWVKQDDLWYLDKMDIYPREKDPSAKEE